MSTPWIKAMMESPAPLTKQDVIDVLRPRATSDRLRFTLEDGSTKEGYLQGAGGLVHSAEAARRHVRMARAGKALRIATPDGMPTHGYLYSTPDWCEIGRVVVLDLAKVTRVEAA